MSFFIIAHGARNREKFFREMKKENALVIWTEFSYTEGKMSRNSIGGRFHIA
jgi:hypothetical protein